MKKIRLVALISAICMASGLHAKSLEETVKFCEECHGANGISEETDIPTIAGFSDLAISDIMMAYASDARLAIPSKFRYGDTTRPETDMNEISKNLSEEQIEELASYYSELAFVPAKQSFEADKAAKGAKIHDVQCAKCHEEGGTSPDDDVGLLAGQWTPYLRTSLTNFRNDKRDTEKKMLKLVKKLSDKELDYLLNYWASQQ